MRIIETFHSFDNVTDGDAIEAFKLTCKIRALKSIISKRRARGLPVTGAQATINHASAELRQIARRYA